MSTTIIASIIALATLALPVVGIEVVDQGTLTSTVTQFAGVLAILYTFYGRYRAGGINAFGLRKKTD